MTARWGGWSCGAIPRCSISAAACGSCPRRSGVWSSGATAGACGRDVTGPAVVRRAPHPRVGTRRAHQHRELCVAVPASPHVGARRRVEPATQHRRHLRSQTTTHRLSTAPAPRTRTTHRRVTSARLPGIRTSSRRVTDGRGRRPTSRRSSSTRRRRVRVRGARPRPGARPRCPAPAWRPPRSARGPRPRWGSRRGVRPTG